MFTLTFHLQGCKKTILPLEAPCALPWFLDTNADDRSLNSLFAPTGGVRLHPSGVSIFFVAPYSKLAGSQPKMGWHDSKKNHAPWFHFRESASSVHSQNPEGHSLRFAQASECRPLDSNVMTQIHMAMGQNPEPPVNIPIPTKID